MTKCCGHLVDNMLRTWTGSRPLIDNLVQSGGFWDSCDMMTCGSCHRSASPVTITTGNVSPVVSRRCHLTCSGARGTRTTEIKGTGGDGRLKAAEASVCGDEARSWWGRRQCGMRLESRRHCEVAEGGVLRHTGSVDWCALMRRCPTQGKVEQDATQDQVLIKRAYVLQTP